MDDVCRICMSQDSSMIDIFEPVLQEIVAMIEFCTGLLFQKALGLPSQMCDKCLSDLHTAHRFKTKCIEADKVFQELQSKHGSIKCELETENLERDDTVDSEDRVSFDVKFNSEEEMEKSKAVEKNSIQSDMGAVRRKNEMSDRKAKKPRVKRRKSASSEPKLKQRRGINKFRRLFCEPCQLKFNSRQESEEHKKSLHKEDQSWICEVCGRAYAHRSSQIAHMRSHYAASYACDNCDYSTYNKYDLIKHVRIHTGDKSFKCARCPAAYRTSSNLSAHVRQSHERVRAYTCHVCGNAFHDRATLLRHIDAHSDIKRHVCEVCSTGFTKRSYWKNHLKKQHDISIPDVRPGPPKTNAVIVERGEKSSK